MNAKEKTSYRWLILDILSLAYLIIFIAVSFLIEPYWIQIDSYLSDAIGFKVDFVFGIVSLASIALLYSFLLTVVGLLSIKSGKGFFPRIINKILPFILLIAFGVLLLLLGILWGDDASLIFSALEYLSPAIFFALIFSITVFLYFNLHSMMKIVRDTKEKAIHISSRKSITTILILIFCGFVYISPSILLPANVVQGSLSAKPNLIGHRCSSSLGPENTLETADTALSFGIVGVEVDIQISIDGIPFLLHDDTFKRTTNVGTIFPEKESERATSFLISEIRQLDAGSWFADSDPFGTIASNTISSTKAEGYRDAQIPTLVEILNFVEQENLILNTDFKYPPQDHPFYDSYLNICLSLIEESEIDDQIWITSWNQETLAEVKTSFPDMHAVLSVGPNSAPGSMDFLEMGFDMINTHHGLSNSLFKEYDNQGISVNTWTVNSIPRFSQIWCVGVDYVTTDNPQDFQNLEYPYWCISFPIYATVWIVLDIVCIIIIGLRYHRSSSID